MFENLTQLKLVILVLLRSLIYLIDIKRRKKPIDYRFPSLSLPNKLLSSNCNHCKFNSTIKWLKMICTQSDIGFRQLHFLMFGWHQLERILLFLPTITTTSIT